MVLTNVGDNVCKSAAQGTGPNKTTIYKDIHGMKGGTHCDKELCWANRQHWGGTP